jgi:hypothetical protein
MWDELLNVLSFTGITSVTVWQAVVLNSIFIPIAIVSFRSLWIWFNSKKPLQQLLSDYLSGDTDILIFIPQLSGALDDFRFNPDQKYIINYPDPSPTNKNRLTSVGRQNVDPVWSEGDGECLADVYNILGRSGKIGGIKIANTIKHWEEWSSPSVSIGFSPKTHKFIDNCDPIYFNLANNEASLMIEGSNIALDSILPNDAGIIQKTHRRNTGNSVLILAGLGTMGTSAAGHYLTKNCVNLGKMYGSKPFCVLLRVRTDQGKTSVTACASYPKPNWNKVFLHPITYYKFKQSMNV